VITDRDRIAAAFKALRKQGFETHMNWQCCQSCGGAALRDGTSRWAFYHRQDATGFNRDGNIRDAVHIAFGATVEDGQAIQKALTDAGLRVAWDGTVAKRPAVLGIAFAASAHTPTL
jgi:hypothetical protein